MKNVLGLVNLYSNAEMGKLTESRTIGSTSFLGRYAFMDFALSNFTNSGVDSIGVMIKKFPRSVLKHLGNFNSWNINTKTGSTAVMVNEFGILNPPYNNDTSNIQANDWLLLSKNINYVIIQPAHIITNIDFRPILKQHIEKHSKVTAVYSKINNGDKSFKNGYMFDINESGNIVFSAKNNCKKADINIATESFIINLDTLKEVVDMSNKIYNGTYSLQDILTRVVNKEIKVDTYEYKGYLRCFDSLSHFLEYTFELFEKDTAHSLFVNDWPIYTKTHDTPPTTYGAGSSVKNSFIANGAIIEGSVRNSVISRDVVIAKGAKITNSIILTKSYIGPGVTLDYAVIDKYSKITTKDTTLKGTLQKPFYVKQGAKI